MTILRNWALIILVLLVWGVGSAALPFLFYGIPVGLFGWWLWWETRENGWGPGSGHVHNGWHTGESGHTGPNQWPS